MPRHLPIAMVNLKLPMLDKDLDAVKRDILALVGAAAETLEWLVLAIPSTKTRDNECHSYPAPIATSPITHDPSRQLSRRLGSEETVGIPPGSTVA